MSESDKKKRDVFDEVRLKRLVELMKEHDLHEVELRDAEQQIRICRSSSQAPQLGFGPMMPQYGPGGYSAPPPPQPAAGAPMVPAPEPESENIVVIKSPMVGTFYSRPNPKAASYVKVGDHVEVETTICIIEAMKVFNEIPAEVRGKVVAVLVDDEEPVEFGKPLFKVDTKG